MENYKQYLLLRKDILQKPVQLGALSGMELVVPPLVITYQLL